MKRLLMVGILMLVAVCSHSRARSQPGGEQPLVRMERVQNGEAACVLVQEDGKYRLEKNSRVNEIYAGSLDSAGIEQIKGLLANEQLRKITQADIHRPPLVSDNFDTLELDILRERGWLALTFISPDNLKPFKESLDPLLHWFRDLQKQRPNAVRTQDSATRCMPKPTTQLSVQAGTPSVAKPAATDSSAHFLFRLRSIHRYRANADSTCTMVFADGSYHSEHSAQSYRGVRQDKIADGQLQPGAIQELREILSASDLENSPRNPDVRPLPPFQEGTLITLSIPRDSQVQNLIFLTAFNTRDPSQFGGIGPARYRVTDEKVIQPLKKWMKDNIDAQRRGTEKTGVANDCTLLKSGTTAEKGSN